uniref:Uncharacterized protein n=1 Tax=Solanum lycopersicum TaxID=4081 RepID=A0A3Q7I7H0_SOLLC
MTLAMKANAKYSAKQFNMKVNLILAVSDLASSRFGNDLLIFFAVLAIMGLVARSILASKGVTLAFAAAKEWPGVGISKTSGVAPVYVSVNCTKPDGEWKRSLDDKVNSCSSFPFSARTSQSGTKVNPNN